MLPPKYHDEQSLYRYSIVQLKARVPIGPGPTLAYILPPKSIDGFQPGLCACNPPTQQGHQSRLYLILKNIQRVAVKCSWVSYPFHLKFNLQKMKS